MSFWNKMADCRQLSIRKKKNHCKYKWLLDDLFAATQSTSDLYENLSALFYKINNKQFTGFITMEVGEGIWKKERGIGLSDEWKIFFFFFAWKTHTYRDMHIFNRWMVVMCKPFCGIHWDVEGNDLSWKTERNGEAKI